MNSIELYSLYKKQSTTCQRINQLKRMQQVCAKNEKQQTLIYDHLKDNEKVQLIVDIYVLIREESNFKACIDIFGYYCNSLFFVCMKSYEENENNRMVKTCLGNIIKEYVLCDLFYYHVLFNVYKKVQQYDSICECILIWFQTMENIHKIHVEMWRTSDQKLGISNLEWSLYQSFFCVINRFLNCEIMITKITLEKQKKTTNWIQFSNYCKKIMTFMQKVHGSENDCEGISNIID